MSCYCKSCVALPHGAVGRSAVCDSGISYFFSPFDTVFLKSAITCSPSHIVYFAQTTRFPEICSEFIQKK